MELQLSKLHEMHPLLNRTTAWEYSHRASVGLARHSHGSGTIVEISIDGKSEIGHLHWHDAVEDREGALLDFHRVTEDAAEAIALALVHAAKGWIVRRRLQRGEFADWLLIDGDRKLVALEVSGVDTIDVAQRRLREKVLQVGKCRVPGTKVACVAELRPPRSRIRAVQAHGH